MLRFSLILFLSSIALHNTHASGGDYGGGATSSGPINTQSRPVDARYEQGKAIFTGRASAYKKVKYCFKDETDTAQKVKSKAIKAYRNGSVGTLLGDLYRCDDTSQNIANVLKRNELVTVAYYLNKRYKLKLK